MDRSTSRGRDSKGLQIQPPSCDNQADLNEEKPAAVVDPDILASRL